MRGDNRESVRDSDILTPMFDDITRKSVPSVIDRIFLRYTRSTYSVLRTQDFYFIAKINAIGDLAGGRVQWPLIQLAPFHSILYNYQYVMFTSDSIGARIKFKIDVFTPKY